VNRLTRSADVVCLHAGFAGILPAGFAGILPAGFAVILSAGFAVILSAGLAVALSSGPLEAAEPERRRLDAAFVTAADRLADEAADTGLAALAEFIRGWHVPDEPDRLVAFRIPPGWDRPSAVRGDAAERLWTRFVDLRRRRAAATLDLAVAAARAGRPGEAIAMLHRSLRDDPDHDRGRRAGGWVRRDDRWVRPEVARRLDRGEADSTAFGWLPQERLARYLAGERYDRGRWLSAADDAARTLPVARGRRFVTDHWEVLSTAPLETAAAVGEILEETRLVWHQVLGGFAIAPDALARQLVAPDAPRAIEPLAAVLCADRGQYVGELEPLDPLATQTTGFYWTPTRTLWLHAVRAAPDADDVEPPAAMTLRHEATHQLCLELPTAGRTVPAAGTTRGFWAIEGIACFMESIRRTPFGWTVGGQEAARQAAARALLLDDGFFVPLEELAGLGREAFQADARIARLYVQAAGMADFLLIAGGGRHREAFLAYLALVYADAAEPDSLARLCGTSLAELDEQYRRHLSR